MADELIDILNDQGQIVDQKMKSEAHQKGLLHKAVHVMIYDPTCDSVLIQKRCAAKELFPSMWDVSAAGHVGAGEDDAITAQRETMEEIGLDVPASQIQFMWTLREDCVFKKINSREFVQCFLVTVPNIRIEDLKYQKEEVEQAKLVKVQDFFKMIEAKDFIPHEEEYKLWRKHFLK